MDAQAITVRLPREIYENLRQTAFDRRATMNALITDAITEWLRTYATPEPEDTEDTQENTR